MFVGDKFIVFHFWAPATLRVHRDAIVAQARRLGLFDSALPSPSRLAAGHRSPSIGGLSLHRGELRSSPGTHSTDFPSPFVFAHRSTTKTLKGRSSGTSLACKFCSLTMQLLCPQPNTIFDKIPLAIVQRTGSACSRA